MLWARMLAYITGTVDQELLLRNEYLAAENRILRTQIKGRLLLSHAEKATLAEIAHRLGRNAYRNEDAGSSAFCRRPRGVRSERPGLRPFCSCTVRHRHNWIDATPSGSIHFQTATKIAKSR